MRTIRAARPSQLYIAADGPRHGRSEEKELCEQARNVALEVDWECEVKTLFRDENLGLRKAVSGALDWFFQNESRGIILEDDCIPHPTFFTYCSELLSRYENDARIMAISGNNFQLGEKPDEESYYFSRYMHCWGWATWRRAWSKYDADMTQLAQFTSRNELQGWASGDPGFAQYWMSVFDECSEGRIDSWAYRYQLSCWEHSGLTILPAINLVSNVGFGVDATHTHDSDSPQSALPSRALEFPLLHPQRVTRNVYLDSCEHRIFFPHFHFTWSQRLFSLLGRQWQRALRVAARVASGKGIRSRPTL